MLGYRKGNTGAKDQFKPYQIILGSVPPPFSWALRGPTSPAAQAGRRGGTPKPKGLLCKGLIAPAGGLLGPCPPLPLTARTWSAPPPFRPAPHARGGNAPPTSRAGARERAPRRGSAPRGRTRARWRPRRGRLLGRGSSCWERRAGAPRPCQSGTHCSGPGPGWSPRTPSPRPQAARASGLGAGQPPPTPTLGPTPARLLPSTRGITSAHSPPLEARAACRPQSLVPLAWKTSLLSPGPPILGFP